MAEHVGASTIEPEVDWGKEVRKFKEKNKSSKDFLPANHIERFSTKQFIRDVLTSERMSESQITELERYISGRPAKLSFLLLVSINRAPWMESLANPKYNFSDDDLLTADIIDEYLTINRHQKDVKILFHNSDASRSNDQNDIQLFNLARWSFLAPVFTTTKFYQEFNEAVPLPFLKVPDFKPKNGSFGVVHKVELHHAHQLNIVPSDGKTNIPVALKIIQNMSEHIWFLREMKILEKIQAIVKERPDLQLITPIASYRVSNDSGGCLLFPWAEGGNLKDFWDREENKAGALNQNSRYRGLAKMAWALKQMEGLCKALVELHKPHSPNGASMSNEETPHLRHGDLKPENILVFREGDEDILRIADLGLGRFHLKSTDGRKKAKEYTKTITGTTRYMPPEFEDNNVISRRLDVWSLGCLFIEFVIWAAWGLEALDKFNNIPNDAFWQKRSNSDNVVHDNISNWINSMEKVLLPNTALRDILELVSVGMLKQLPQRHTSQKIYNKLKTIVERSQEKDDYCLDWNQKANILGHILPAVESGSQNRGQNYVSLLPVPLRSVL
ncbi:hypothetical protein FPSE5266_10517 [Fusarium pseudograminearum]|nr:hypothetical protein FPSE5266_10517 [Fusarium pseudograminearum]